VIMKRSTQHFRGENRGATNKGPSEPGIEATSTHKFWKYVGMFAPPRPLDDPALTFRLDEMALTHPSLSASASPELEQPAQPLTPPEGIYAEITPFAQRIDGTAPVVGQTALSYFLGK